MNYEETTDYEGKPVRVFTHAPDAWDALTPQMIAEGWKLCCFGGYENAHVKEQH